MLRFRHCLTGLAFLACLLQTLPSFSQPYVDLLRLQYLNAFRVGNNAGTPFQHRNAQASLPLKLHSGGYFLLNPFYESWSLDSNTTADYFPAVHSIGLPLILQLPLKKNRWSLTLAVIPRCNSEGLKISDRSFQIGGATLLQYQFRPELKVRAGVYVNREFFGIYVVPLAGIDWKLGPKDFLFGTLPGKLSFEHQLSKRFYTGIAYVSTTNSYLLDNGMYLRIGDNRVSAFLDFYAGRRIVFTADAGYGILRKLGLGRLWSRDYTQEYKWGDGFFAQLSAAYRIRL